MTVNTPIKLLPIGWVRSSRRHIRDDQWETEDVAIELDETQFIQSSLI